ncbi:cellulose biosynthesis protein BcsE [Azotobacter armeniacus]
MSLFSLSIPHLWEEWAQMRCGGLYWLVCEQADEVDRLCLQVLAGMRCSQRVVLLVCGRRPDAIHAALDDHEGPGELIPYEFAEPRAKAALNTMPRDLQRLLAPRGVLLMLVVPSSVWSEFGDRELHDWCRRLREWLDRRACTLLVVNSGKSQSIASRLLACNDSLAGLAQLYHGRGGIRYLLHFWRNALGVRAGGEVGFERVGDRFVCRPETEQGGSGPTASDQHHYLAPRAVLEGAPPLSEHWRLFDDVAVLLAAAMRSTASSVVLGIGSNEQVSELARHVYALRRQRGKALKLVVRELAPCLRYLDEQLLLICGASLIVPHGVGLSRFLTMLDSVQGQTWTRTLPTDFEGALDYLRPPSLRGLLPTPKFVAVVRDIIEQAPGREVSHLLLRLRVAAGLDLSQVLGQCRLRRYGDMACVAGGDLYLFLFACRPNALDSALGNIFRLSWRELFASHEILDGVQGISPDVVANDCTVLPSVPVRGGAQSAATGPVRLAPVRVSLGKPAAAP